jgi:hypothetical protein
MPEFHRRFRSQKANFVGELMKNKKVTFIHLTNKFYGLMRKLNSRYLSKKQAAALTCGSFPVF